MRLQERIRFSGVCKSRIARNAFISISVLVLLSASCGAQTVQLNWSENSERCWFRDRTTSQPHSFYTVDILSGQRKPAYDPEQLAHAFSDHFKREIAAENLKVTGIGLTGDPLQLLVHAFAKTWKVDLNEYILTQDMTNHASDAVRPLFLPPRKSRDGGESTQIQVENQLDQTVHLFWIDRGGKPQKYGSLKAGESRKQHTFVNHVWLLRSDSHQELGCFTAARDDVIVLTQQLVDSVRVTKKSEPAITRNPSHRSPDSRWAAFIREHQLWIKSKDGEIRLSSTASEENSFGKSQRPPFVRWSPDSKHLVAFQTKKVSERTVHLIESSPADQLQPRLHSFSYRKPGDDLPTQTLRLYSVEDSDEIKISDDLFANPWSLKFLGWSKDGESFRLLYNQRGHQVLRLLEVRVSDGTVRTLIEEKSDTFIHYSTAGKAVLENLDSKSILWSSERSGWNHLYRYSAETGEVLNSVTAGNWNVRRIMKIDRETKTIWFDAVGIMKDQDPYHEHFCRVNFDGSDLQVLTEGDGTHNIEFQKDGEYFVDTYSRVDMAPVSELRESKTGKLVCELTRQEASGQFDGRRLTERFVAKGRDGTTDIWGIIHWPKDFDTKKKYPVVEYIYAGPHDYHVPKSFRSQYRHQYQIADAGMIVVQIDGMGTAWRSKAFHDLCYKNLKDAGFPDRIEWMKAAAEKYPQMDLDRVGIYGGSAGGQNAMAALLWHNEFYKVAVADCGCHDNRMDKIWWNEQWMGWPIDESYKRNSNMENAHLLKGDLMLIVGELDRNVDPASTTQVVSKLIKHNKDFEFVLVAGAGHGSAETPWASRKRMTFLREHLLAK